MQLIGFGFVVARFGLFVRELAANKGVDEPCEPISATLGILMIFAGIAIAIFGGYRYASVERALVQGQESRLSVRDAYVAVVVLCALGIVTVFVITGI